MRGMAEARRRVRHEEKVDLAFDAFMDHLVDKLVEAGFQPADSIAAVFTVAEMLAEQGTLPPYPTERASLEQKARWLVKAVDFGFVDFVLEAVG